MLRKAITAPRGSARIRQLKGYFAFHGPFSCFHIFPAFLIMQVYGTWPGKLTGTRPSTLHTNQIIFVLVLFCTFVQPQKFKLLVKLTCKNVWAYYHNEADTGNSICCFMCGCWWAKGLGGGGEQFQCKHFFITWRKSIGNVLFIRQEENQPSKKWQICNGSCIHFNNAERNTGGFLTLRGSKWSSNFNINQGIWFISWFT